MLSRRSLLAGLAALSILSGCSTLPNTSPQDHRDSILSMRDNTLNDLFALKDSAKAEILASPGYAVFNSSGVKILVVGAGGGRGVVVDNRTGKNTFMNMAEIGAGLGLGIKDVRVVFVFHNQTALDDFLFNGISIGANADAAAKLSDKGDAGSGQIVLNNMSVYQITDNGLALELMITGTKYWPAAKLN